MEEVKRSGTSILGPPIEGKVVRGLPGAGEPENGVAEIVKGDVGVGVLVGLTDASGAAPGAAQAGGCLPRSPLPPHARGHGTTRTGPASALLPSSLARAHLLKAQEEERDGTKWTSADQEKRKRNY